jgi:two-component system alkaline phosphatase synthesis response regulator PhoP
LKTKAPIILIADDEEDILEFLSYNLTQDGYEVHTCGDGNAAIKMAKSLTPDLIMLDIMMPFKDGIEVCTELRKDKKLNNTLIVFLSARSESFTQVMGLESGGDDFIHKPIKPNVLKSKIKSILRRKAIYEETEDDKSNLKFNDLVINVENFTIALRGEEVNLTKKEFEILLLLSSKPLRVFRREEILDQVWGEETIVGSRTLDVHIRKIREKLGEDLISTYKGVGYRFEVKQESKIS